MKISSFLQNAATRSGIIGELFYFLWQRKLWWLIPMIVVLAVFIVLMLLAIATGSSPFLYSLI